MNANTENTVNRTEILANAVDKAVYNLSAIASAIKGTDTDMLAVLDAASFVGKGGAKGGALDKLFRVDFKGMDRRKLVTWFETYSPIRPRFEDSGKFKDVAWSDGFVKQAKTAGKPVFDLENAKHNPWWSMEEADKGMSLRTKKAETIATMAIRAATKAALGESKDGKFRTDIFEEVLNNVIRAMREGGTKEALEYASTDRMESWANALMIHKSKQESARLQSEAEAKKA